MGKIQDGKRTPDIAKAADCSERSIIKIRSNLRRFGSTRAPAGRGGRPPSITAPMLKALCDQLLDRPELYFEEMAVFLYDEFGLNVHGYLDQAVNDYTDWKISQAISDIWKDGFRRAGDIALQNGLDLDLLYKNGKKVFDGDDIPEGLAEQYARDIKFWIENYHQGDEEV